MFISDGIISIRIAEPEDASLIYRWENDRSLWRVSATNVPPSLFQIEQKRIIVKSVRIIKIRFAPSALLHLCRSYLVSG